MSTSFFDNAYFLQSIGWGIANSFWQAAVLWLIYRAIVQSNKKMTAATKYQLSVSLLFIAAAWFCYTIIQNYWLLPITNAGAGSAWAVRLQSVTAALPFAGVFYFGMLTFYLLRFIRQYLQLRSISTKGLIKAPVEIRIFTMEKALHLGIKKKVQVWLTDHIDVPAVTGFIKPIILLPAAIAGNLSVEQVNAILLHELAHIKRNDFLLNLIKSLVSILLFFNPFVYLLDNIAKKERENCCDDWVLNFGFNPLEYAKALLILEEQRQEQLVLAMAATSNKKMLLQRIRRIMVSRDAEITGSRLQKFRFYGFIVLMITCVYLFPIFTTNDFHQGNSNKIASVAAARPVLLTKESNGNSAGVEKEYAVVKVAGNIPTAVRSPKIARSKKPLVKKHPVSATDDYVLALVNEDALPGKIKKEQELLTPVSNKEKDSLQTSFLVKIEEEQSGKKQRTTYYFKLKSDNGTTSLKPLLFIKKFKVASLKKTDGKLQMRKQRVTT